MVNLTVVSYSNVLLWSHYVIVSCHFHNTK